MAFYIFERKGPLCFFDCSTILEYAFRTSRVQDMSGTQSQSQ
jgi:hypothetical protein